MKKRVIISAGGTGGHIFPALAIAKELIKRNIQVLFVGNRDSLEAKIMAENMIEFQRIDVQKLYRSITAKHLLFPYKFMKSYSRVSNLFNSYQPSACIGTGGFVSGPAVLKSILSKTPLFLQEQNSYPGLTTKLFSRYANCIFLGSEDAAKYLPKANCIYTGNPINIGVNLNTSNRQSKVNTLLILGGSLGAKSINDIVLAALPELLKLKLDIIWQTGKNNYKSVKAVVDNEKISVVPFIKDMDSIYNKTDIAISRGGAITLAELETKNIPSIIIPIAKTAGNHQYMNALSYSETGRGLLLEQKNLTIGTLIDSITRLVNHYEEYSSIEPKYNHLKAAEVIADIISKQLWSK